MINPTISEWLNLISRWVHVFAGIMWVGTTYYFTWLDARMTEEEKALANTGNAAQIWMVHSGGFYVVEKRKVPDRAFAQAALVPVGSRHDVAERFRAADHRLLPRRRRAGRSRRLRHQHRRGDRSRHWRDGGWLVDLRSADDFAAGKK